jgi:predicted dehydrogenase
MWIRLAFVGFRHAHLFEMYRDAQEAEGIEVVAACEEDATTREQLAAHGEVLITHDDFDELLVSVDCDAVAVGDYYSKRGSLAIRALSAGKHVISDKPLCTRLEELHEIARLSSQNGLRVGCMLGMRDTAPMITARKLIQTGTIGEIRAISFGGQHPLLLGSRPAWYFEPGKHGGTINDIGVHALDVLPWITGHRFATLNAARCWNAVAEDYPHFEGAGQLMLTMDNGCGVLGDVSYLSPDSWGYRLPFYWRLTFWGSRGVLEVSATSDHVTLALDGEDSLCEVPLAEGTPGAYLRAFAHDIAGTTQRGELCTEDVLRVSHVALLIQSAADSGACQVRLGDSGQRLGQSANLVELVHSLAPGRETDPASTEGPSTGDQLHTLGPTQGCCDATYPSARVHGSTIVAPTACSRMASGSTSLALAPQGGKLRCRGGQRVER